MKKPAPRSFHDIWNESYSDTAYGLTDNFILMLNALDECLAKHEKGIRHTFISELISIISARRNMELEEENKQLKKDVKHYKKIATSSFLFD